MINLENIGATLLALMEERNIYLDKYSVDPKTKKQKRKHKLYNKKIASSYLFFVLTSQKNSKRYVGYNTKNDFEWIKGGLFSQKQGYIDPRNIETLSEKDVIAKNQNANFINSGRIKAYKIDELREQVKKTSYFNDEDSALARLASGVLDTSDISQELLNRLNL
ncbi:MAG: hypothetical protein PHO04_02930 [Candidatus Pacebacteria bacterium]|jgi:hypothetical protein|nr:hypothetical protein [Candidatus Paceibacterota bacterium]MDD2796815.1 hypothetical protein [Candidatus Paceibacterota bacterium]MDD3918560.1 hypothetical protein [Candidatus Paceibacterota bacterium]MDD4664757.1 hypothetical protein [Candidatus Paceibacterota bacterium]